MSAARYAPLSVNAPWSNTTTQLQQRLGWPAVVAWYHLIVAAKRSPILGQITYTSDAIFWQLLGMDGDPPNFTPTELLSVLGRLRQTRRTCSGRTTYVQLTRYQDWNDADRRHKATERKARYRREKGQDSGGTPGETSTGQGEDTSVTEVEVEVEREEEQRQDQSSPTSWEDPASEPVDQSPGPDLARQSNNTDTEINLGHYWQQRQLEQQKEQAAGDLAPIAQLAPAALRALEEGNQ